MPLLDVLLHGSLKVAAGLPVKGLLPFPTLLLLLVTTRVQLLHVPLCVSGTRQAIFVSKTPQGYCCCSCTRLAACPYFAASACQHVGPALHVILCASDKQVKHARQRIHGQGSSPMQAVFPAAADLRSLQPLAMHPLTLPYVQNRQFKCKGWPKPAQGGMAVHSEVLLQPMLSACQLKQQSMCCKVYTPLLRSHRSSRLPPLSYSCRVVLVHDSRACVCVRVCVCVSHICIKLKGHI